MKWAPALTTLAGALVVAGCGLAVQSPDLFLLTRAGQGGKLTLLVNDGGTIRCNGRARPLSGHLLVVARDLASSLDGDAKQRLRIAQSRGSVYRYTIQLQNGTVAFPDSATAGGKFPALAQAELFTVEAARQSCGLSG